MYEVELEFKDFKTYFIDFQSFKKTTRQEIDCEVEELKLGFSEMATKIWRNFHPSFDVTNWCQILWLSQNFWSLPKYNTYSWGNEPIVNHGSVNFSLLHVSNFVVMCSISFSPNFLRTKKLSLLRILVEIFWKKKIKQPFRIDQVSKDFWSQKLKLSSFNFDKVSRYSQLVLSGFYPYAWS